MASRSRPPSPMIKIPVEDESSSSSEVEEQDAPTLQNPPQPVAKKPGNPLVARLKPKAGDDAPPGTPELRDRYNVNSPRRPPRKRPSEHSVGPEQIEELDDDEEPAFDWGDAVADASDGETPVRVEAHAAPPGVSAGPDRSSATSAGETKPTSAGDSSGDDHSQAGADEPPQYQPPEDTHTGDGDEPGVPAPSFVTQVSRDGTPARAPDDEDASSAAAPATPDADSGKPARRPSAFMRCFSCFLPTQKKRTGLRALEGEHRATQHHMVPVPESLGLLKPLPPGCFKKTLVLDLDETLVHSSFALVDDADFVVDIRIDRSIHKVYVRKRPGVDEFLKALSKRFDLVLFTASLPVYADPLLDILDPDGLFSIRLFRDSCVNHHQVFVKDLSKLGRPLNSMCLIDNSPQSFLWHPGHAIPIESWFEDRSDTQLYELIPFLNDVLYHQHDFSDVLDGHRPMTHIFRQIPPRLRWTPDSTPAAELEQGDLVAEHDEPRRQVRAVTLNVEVEVELEETSSIHHHTNRVA